ncbi:hypothetical protein OSSY52_03140 [Tepiditoga spiralis]|uniref:Capsule synthesis protein CapA domain-containing protein n=1 Tax=Tepiditoga spiralis TaxID=2108365 RepID=A0A7G1G5W3_9BACT|nr:CapA family protein [Tepiditoga spiralis]BBE30173.1 hypothetical protein OSSY52_03140 [Tepiditoga spiralis]
MKINLAGDVSFSLLKGEAKNFMIREKEEKLFKIFLSKILNKLNINYKLYYNYMFKDIKLKEYSNEQILYNTNIQIRDINPFEHMKQFFKEADISFFNLETPISNKGRHVGDFNSEIKYLNYIKDLDISLVSIANNHMFDNGEIGFEETLKNLENNNIRYIGGGWNLSNARTLKTIEKKGIKITFLAYTDHCNRNFYGLARENNSGILPLYSKLIKKDINRAKKISDYVFVYLHFVLENKTLIHKEEQKIARKIIDYGADVLIGGHSHVPKGFEIYNNKPIIYSLGNFIFGYNSKNWGNNLVSTIELNKNKISEIKIYPILSKKEYIFSPIILNNSEGIKLLTRIKKDSKKYCKTKLLLNEKDCYLSYKF